jgi:hypothetical protein
MEGGMNLVFQTPAWLTSNAIPRAVPIGGPEPRLAFMFAQQSITLLRKDADRLGELVDAGVEGAELGDDALAGRQRVGVWRERVGPFANYIDIAVRFEAQEVLAALDEIDRVFARVLRRTQPAPWRDPNRLAAELQARRQQAAA